MLLEGRLDFAFMGQGLDAELQHEMNLAGIERNIERLDRIETRVSPISVPLSYREELYDLRLHIDMLRKKLREASAKGPSSP